MARSSCLASGVSVAGVGVGGSGVGISVDIAMGCVDVGGIRVEVGDGPGPQPLMAQARKAMERSSEVNLFILPPASDWTFTVILSANHTCVDEYSIETLRAQIHLEGWVRSGPGTFALVSDRGPGII